MMLIPENHEISGIDSLKFMIFQEFMIELIVSLDGSIP